MNHQSAITLANFCEGLDYFELLEPNAAAVLDRCIPNATPSTPLLTLLSEDLVQQAIATSLALDDELMTVIVKFGGVNQVIARLKPIYQTALAPWLAKASREKTIAGANPYHASPLQLNPSAAISEQQLVRPEQQHPSGLSVTAIQQLEKSLSRQIFGQQRAIRTLVERLLSSLFKSHNHRPLASLFFVGPAATGKTFLAEQIAQHLGDEWQTLTISMVSLVNASQSAMLDGTEPSYNNAKPGVLTDFVRQHPKSVVIFDDIDKAHPAIISKLSAIFTRGCLRDQFGFYPNNDIEKAPLAPAEVDFRQTIVIFTSHELEDLYASAAFQQMLQSNSSRARATLYKGLQDLVSSYTQSATFDSSLLNALGAEAIVSFNPLSLDDLIAIARHRFLQLSQQFANDFHCKLHISQPDKFYKLLVLSLAPDIDARKISGQLLDTLINQIILGGAEHSLPTHVEWRLAPQAEQQFAELCSQSPNEQLIQWMMRQGLVLNLAFATELIEHRLTLTLESFSTEKVIQHADLKGLGSINIEVPSVPFSAIVGHHLVKTRLQQTIKLLKQPNRLLQHQVKMPKGLLLYGPPGTGKTMLAKAFAHEADLPFLSVSGTDLLDLNFVKALFNRARKYAPAVLFIDEIDVVGSREHKGYGVIINQLLTEIDGFSTELTAPVFIIAATNRPQDLDPALVRAGRIDIHIHVPTLDREARSFFIKRYFELPHDGSLEEETLLSLTSGMSGAELEQTRREVVLEMIRQDLTSINQQMLMEFINQRKYGHRATVQRTLDDLTSTAYHEAGHAVVSRILNPETIIEQISITSRGNMAGFVAFVSDAQRNKRLTAQEVLEEMAVLLAGRCAEVIKFGQDHICAGASSDLAKASTWAFEAISVFGLDAEIGLISLAGLPKEIPQAYNQKILERIDFWLKAAEAISVNTLKQHWQTVERLVVHLLSQDVISGTVLEDIMKNQVDSLV